MRIGEIAALHGATPRGVRHYHHLGLLPEPLRLSDGYRECGVREPTLLALAARFPDRSAGTLANGIFVDLAPARPGAITRAREVAAEKQEGPS
ncbi:MerR family DNA-binding transcriptional regulator [Streptomyces sp. NPDC058542]|uniref:MerR family DNA-binding transcriptional regulator n=1 Tax=Streptomyces sp. NPDC058542 TaxID=3346543 RepID=UPI00366855A1